MFPNWQIGQNPAVIGRPTPRRHSPAPPPTPPPPRLPPPPPGVRRPRRKILHRIIKTFLATSPRRDLRHHLRRDRHPLPQPKSRDHVVVQSKRKRSIQINVPPIRPALLLDDLRDDRHKHFIHECSRMNTNKTAVTLLFIRDHSCPFVDHLLLFLFRSFFSIYPDFLVLSIAPPG